MHASIVEVEAAGTDAADLERVRCLECGEVYARPGTARRRVVESPDCPRCGYVGWIPLTVPAPPGVPRRSVWDPRHIPSGRRG